MVGEELRALRLSAHMTAKELAKALDLSPPTISRYENGHMPVPRSVVLATRYLCEKKQPPPLSAQRLADAVRAVMAEATG